MFCKHCGQELKAGQKFCMKCGTPVEKPAVQPVPPIEEPWEPEAGHEVPPTFEMQDVPEAPEIPAEPEMSREELPHVDPPQYVPSRPAEPTPAAPKSSASGNLVYKIAAGILAVVFVIAFFRNLFGVFGTLGNVTNGVRHWSIGVTLYILVFSVLLRLVQTIGYLGAAALLGVSVVGRDEENSDSFVAGTIICTALSSVLLLIRAIGAVLFNAIVNSRFMFPTNYLLGLLGNLAAIGIVFLIIMLMEQKPFTGKTMAQIKEDLLLLPSALKTSFRKGKADLDAARQASAERAAAAREAAAQNAAANAQNMSQQPMQQPVPMGYAPVVPGGASALPPASGARVKEDRSLLMLVVLSIVTCGIYSYYHTYLLAKDVNQVCEGDGKHTAGLLELLLLSIVTCGVYGIWWNYAVFNRISENAPRYGLYFVESGTTYLAWSGVIWMGFGPLMAQHLMLKNMNQLCSAYNRINGYHM